MHEHAHDPAFLAREIRSLGLTIEGSRLAPIVEEFRAELHEVGLDAVMPRLYLSTEWGVPDGTIAIAIPFYLASDELTALQEARAGHVEGRNPSDILRYLRHEMGHVVNYAFRLHETAEWVATFGPMSHPYIEEYRPVPFSRDFVRHLPGWYAQKHPDEDWAETFAVWMTPGHDWRAEYANRPGALAKLDYCDREMAEIRQRSPHELIDDLDEDVSEVSATLDEYYGGIQGHGPHDDPGLDGSLRAVFDEPGEESAAALMRRVKTDLGVETFRWTGVFPERVGPLVDALVARADALGLTYSRERETATLLGLAAFVAVMAAGGGLDS